MKTKDNKKRLRLFDISKDGRGVSKNEKELSPGLKRFFVSFKNNFGKLVYVNIFFVLGNFPIFFLLATLMGFTKNSVFMPMSDLFQNINGLFTADGGMTPYKLSLFAIEGLQDTTFASTTLTYVFYGISALTLFTFGLVNVGTAYIIRNLVSGEPVFVWSDFIYAVKRNVKQALPFGLIDAAICALLTFNIYTLVFESGAFIGSMLFWSEIILFILYFFMRLYIYVQMVTFKLSIYKMIKNSLIFAILGFKRNILAFLGIIFLLLFELVLMFGTGGILVPFAVAAPLAILLSLMSFIKVYAAYPKIKQYMIDPYLDEHPEERAEPSDDEVIMKDDVTEKERLEEIKKRNSIT